MPTFELQNTGWEYWIRPKTVYCNGRMWLGGIDDQGQVRVDVIAPDGTCHRAVVSSFSGSDEHNSAAILAVTGKVPIIFYSAHNTETVVRYKRGTVNADNGLRTMGAQATLSMGVGTTVTYPQVFNIGDVIHLIIRVSTGSGQSRYLNYARSSDWAQTWDVAPVKILDAGGTTAYLYNASAHITDGSNEILRIGMTDDPAHGRPHDVYYCEMNLGTGAIYKPEAPGVTIANAQTGVGCPAAMTGMSLVHSPTGNYSIRHFDTSRGAVPELLWVEYDDNDTQATAMYKYAAFVSGSWVVNPICRSGHGFGVEPSGGLMGGAHFTNVSDGDIILSRVDDDEIWTVERWHTDDHGATWTSSVIAFDTVPLAKPFQIEGTGGFKAVYERYTKYGTSITDAGGYTNWAGSLIVTDQ